MRFRLDFSEVLVTHQQKQTTLRPNKVWFSRPAGSLFVPISAAEKRFVQEFTSITNVWNTPVVVSRPPQIWAQRWDVCVTMETGFQVVVGAALGCQLVPPVILLSPGWLQWMSLRVNTVQVRRSSSELLKNHDGDDTYFFMVPLPMPRSEK